MKKGKKWVETSSEKKLERQKRKLFIELTAAERICRNCSVELLLEHRPFRESFPLMNFAVGLSLYSNYRDLNQTLLDCRLWTIDSQLISKFTCEFSIPEPLRDLLFDLLKILLYSSNTDNYC